MPDEPTKPKSVRNLRAPTPEAMKAIRENYDLTPETANYLLAKIESSGFGGVVVDAHEATRDGLTYFHASITKLFAWLIALLIFSAGTAPAALTSSNMVTYAASGGASTNRGVPVLIGYAYVQASPSFIISDGGTVTTNALTANIKYGLDTNNFTVVTTYTKSDTNAADGVVTPSTLRFPIYAQVELITTNNLTVGAKAVLQQ